MTNQHPKELDLDAVHKLESSGLINRLHDESHTASKGQPVPSEGDTMDGIKASLSDWKGHLMRDSAGAAAGFSIGFLGDVYAPFARKVPWIVGSAVAINTIYSIATRDTDESRSKHFTLAKFGTDVLSTATAGLLAGRIAWGKEGAHHLDYLVTRQGAPRYVPAHTSTYGPKIYSFGAHTEYTGLTLRERTRDVREFLKDRRQLDQFDDALKQIKSTHNPKLEGKIWTRKH